MYNFNDICRIRGILFGILFLFISSGFFLMLWIVAKERGNFFAVYDIFLENGFVTAVNSVSIWEYVISGGFIIFFFPWPLVYDGWQYVICGDIP